MTRAVSGRCLVRNNNLNRGAVALPYRSRKVPLLSTTRDTSFPSFTAFATIPSAVDLRSRTWVYPAFSSFQINSCSAALTCELRTGLRPTPVNETGAELAAGWAVLPDGALMVGLVAVGKRSVAH